MRPHDLPKDCETKKRRESKDSRRFFLFRPHYYHPDVDSNASDGLLCCACRYPACPPITPFMWSMTRLCSSCGLNRMTSASSPTLTVCPGGQ